LLIIFAMRYREYLTIFFLLLIALVMVGCGQRFSAILSEPLSENYALATYGTDASHSELNDGDLKTWGITSPPKRDYSITFSEEKKIDRVVVYVGNVVGYQLLCWDSKANKWKIIGGVDSLRGSQRVHAKQGQLQIPRFIHRVSCTTNKIMLRVMKARSDGVVTTRTPPKNVKILNQRVEYVTTPRGRVRIDLYEIFKQGNATIREIEAYSHVEKPKKESN